MYLTSYTTKSDDSASKQTIGDLVNAYAKDKGPPKSNFGLLKSLARQQLQNKSTGSYEATALLMGYPCVYSSDRTQTISVGLADFRRRRLKPSKAADLEALNPESSLGLFCNNFTDTYYPARPDELEGWCLMDLFSWFEYSRNDPRKAKKKRKRATKEDGSDVADDAAEEEEDGEEEENDGESEDVLQLLGRTEDDFQECDDEDGVPSTKKVYELKDNLGFLKRRARQKLATTPGIRFGMAYDESRQENNCFSMIQLFVPYRGEPEEVLKKNPSVEGEEFPTWLAAFEHYQASFVKMNTFHERLVEMNKIREAAAKLEQEGMELRNR